MKKLSNLILLSNLICTLFYSMSYPYIYAETIKVVPHFYIGIEQILACVGTIIFAGHGICILIDCSNIIDCF